MKVAYITEMHHLNESIKNSGLDSIPRNFKGMKTEVAWPTALKAHLYGFGEKLKEEYDLGIIIIPKVGDPKLTLSNYITKDFIKIAKEKCKKTAIMQEGPAWYFQRYNLEDQIFYYNCLQQVDILLVHNEIDVKYVKGLTGRKNVFTLPTLMIEDAIPPLPQIERTGTMIGGNFVEWYGGFDSYIVSQAIDEPVYSPKMGQRQQGEENLVHQLPYMDWSQWIAELNKRKYAVHLMKTFAAGTFALNCAYLGIPCIGYKELDTQRICHPNLSVNFGDILEAKKLLRTLHTDKDFYNKCSEEAKLNYKKHYHEDIFNSTFKKQLEVS